MGGGGGPGAGNGWAIPPPLILEEEVEERAAAGTGRAAAPAGAGAAGDLGDGFSGAKIDFDGLAPSFISSFLSFFFILSACLEVERLTELEAGEGTSARKICFR